MAVAPFAAARAYDFVSTLGINTHIDFASFGYQDLATVAASINYLGVKNLRDSAQQGGDAQSWLQISQATGAKFDDFIGQVSPAGMATGLAFMAQLAGEGILNFIEGGNEEDDAFPASLGNTLQITAAFQQRVYATGHALGLPVINMSFGSGWTAANNYQGNYGAVGDLTGFADYGNAHVYPNVGQGIDWSTQRLNGLARLADSQDPVITTEFGWNEDQGFDQGSIAKYLVQAALDGMKDGNPKTYFYSLYDDTSGRYGLMNPDGSAKPAGTALHNLTSLLADSGTNASNFAAGSLSYTLSGSTADDNALLMEKSDGTWWLSLWNESDLAHTVTLTLDGTAAEIKVFSPATGLSPVQDVQGTASVTLSLSDNPLILEVVTRSTAQPAPTPPPAVTSSVRAVSAPVQTMAAPGARISVNGVSIIDPVAASSPGSLALNVSVSGGGTVAIAGQTATSSASVSLSGSLSALNASLAGLTYTAGAPGTDGIAIDVWNQKGIETVATIGVTISGTTPAQSSGAAITIAGDDPSPVILASSVNIEASAGDHMLFIGGTGDTATLTGGTEQVQAYTGHNTITTGAGDDTIAIAGSGNRVDAGSGTNRIADSGGGNTIVMPGAGAGVDQIFGYVISNNDSFDFAPALRGTAWDGATSTLEQFLHVATLANDAIVSISQAAGGPAAMIADLHDSGAVSMSTLLAHSTF